MVYKWPVALLNKINRAIRNFVWSGMVDQCKLCMVSWAKCCFLMSKSGLGIKCLNFFNEALLGKMAWEFISKSSFVFDFFRALYLKVLRKNYYVTSSVWLDLKELYLYLKTKS